MAAEALSRAAAGRHRRVVERAARALRDLEREGATVGLQSVNRRAGVSGQWLSTQPALRSEIERLRDQPRAVADGIPARQRGIEASLRQRLESLRTENQRLRLENADTKTELATR